MFFFNAFTQGNPEIYSEMGTSNYFFSGLPLVLKKFFKVFWISSSFLKVHVFGFVFYLKLSYRLKIVLSSIITQKVTVWLG